MQHIGYDDGSEYVFEVHDLRINKGDIIHIKDEGGKCHRTMSNLVVDFKPELEAERKNYYYNTGIDGVFISVRTSRDFALYLPKDPHSGRVIMIKRGGGDFKVWGNGNEIATTGRRDNLQLSPGEAKTLVFNGDSIWHVVG